MESKIVKKLKPSFETVVLLRSNDKPANATQASKDKYYCVMSLFAQAVTKGKTVVFDRETYGCPGTIVTKNWVGIVYNRFTIT